MVMARQDDIAADVVLAEAVAWLVRLQASDRTPALQSAFDDWLADPAHARAFERATEVWDIIPGAARAHAQHPAVPSLRLRKPLWPVLLGGLLITLLVGFLVSFGGAAAVYETKPGQQQTVTLKDGTRVTLNTDSRLTVRYTALERGVQLVRGEAMFEVIKSSYRPFLVGAADKQVRAIGTRFAVSEKSTSLSVVLTEGKVQITRQAARQWKSEQVAVLSPGERLRVLANGQAIVDRPDIEMQLMWLRGQVFFDDSPLAEAVAEINRYGGIPVKLGNPALATARVSGVFQTHNSAEFAAVVAQLNHLKVERQDGSLILTR